MKAHIIAYCRQNLGDDMFIRCLVRRYPNVRFTCNIPPKLNQAFRNERNLRLPGALDYFMQRVANKLKLSSPDQYRKRAARKSDLLIRIGGSIFIESPNVKRRSWEKLHEKEFVIGANFGPWTSDTFLRDAKKYLSECSDVCFRDRFSYTLFQQLERVRVAPDVLFGYPYYPMPKSGNGVGISVIAAEKRSVFKQISDTYYMTLAAACDYWIERHIPVKLFSFCTAEGDMEAIHSVLDKAKHRNEIDVVAYTGNIEEMLSEMNECDTIIATRFHAMILGWSMGKKVFPVIYSPKQTHVLHDIGWMGPCWDLLSGEVLNSEELIKARESLVPISNIEDLARAAQEQFSGLDGFIIKT